MKPLSLSCLLMACLVIFPFCTPDDFQPTPLKPTFLGDDPIIHPDIDQILKEEMALQNLVGLSVGVLQNGNMIHLKGYGYRDWENEEPVETENVFYMNSISKTITAVLAQRLAEEVGSDFDWNAPVSDWVPEFTGDCNVENETARDDITFSMLLNNTSGIGHYCDFDYDSMVTNFYPGWKTSFNTEDIHNVFCAQPLQHDQQGSFYRYSTFGFNLAGCVLDRAGRDLVDMSYDQMAKNWLVEDWGMDNLTVDYDAFKGKTYRFKMDCEGLITQRTNATDRSWTLPGSGWLCNPKGLLTFAEKLMDGGVNTTQLWQNQAPGMGTNCAGEASSTNYGYGFSLYGGGALGHGGAHPKGGAKSLMYIHPVKEYAIVIMTNSGWWDSGRIRRRISYRLENSNSPVADYKFSEIKGCDSGGNCEDKSSKTFLGVWESSSSLRTIRYELTTEQLERQIADLDACGFKPIDIDTRSQDPGNSWNAVFEQKSDDFATEINKKFELDQFEDQILTYEQMGYEIRDIELYYDQAGATYRWSGVFEKNASERLVRAGLTESEWETYNTQYSDLGYEAIDMEINKRNGIELYACIWEKDAPEVMIKTGLRDPGTGGYPAEINTLIGRGYKIIDREFYDNGLLELFILTLDGANVTEPGMDFCELQVVNDAKWDQTMRIKDLEEK